MSSIVIGVVSGLLVVLLFAGWWSFAKLTSKEALVTEDQSWNKAQDLIYETKIKSVKNAIEDDKKEYTMLFGEREVNHMLNENLPESLRPGRFKIEFGKKGYITARYSRTTVLDRWINVQGKGTFSADDGDFAVDIDQMKVGKFDVPDAAEGQASHWLESLLEKTPWIGRNKWKIKSLKIRDLGLAVTLEIAE